MLVGCPRSNKSAFLPILLPTCTGLLKEATSLGEEGVFLQLLTSVPVILPSIPPLLPCHTIRSIWGVNPAQLS